MTFKKLLKYTTEDYKKQGIYNKEIILKFVIAEILDGYIDLIDAKEDAEMLKKTNNIRYSARGWEITGDILLEAIKIKEIERIKIN